MHRGSVGFRTKQKMFLALNDAEYEDDYVVSLVLNTEVHIEENGCHRHRNKYIIPPGICACITNITHIQTIEESYFRLDTILENGNEIHCTISSTEFSRIYNCLDKNNFLLKADNILGW